MHSQKSTQKTIIIDNTDYPEAVLGDDYFVNPQEYEKVFIKIKSQTTFTSNDKYYKWTMFFIVTLAILVFLLFCAILCYWRQVYTFTRLTNERRGLKKKLMAIHDE